MHKRKLNEYAFLNRLKTRIVNFLYKPDFRK